MKSRAAPRPSSGRLSAHAARMSELAACAARTSRSRDSRVLNVEGPLGRGNSLNTAFIYDYLLPLT